MIVLALPAAGQSVPNGDFETPDLGWEDVSVDCHDFLDGLPPICSPRDGFVWDASQARGAWAGELYSAYGDPSWAYWWTSAAESDPFVVTTRTLSWAQSQGSTTVTIGGSP